MCERAFCQLPGCDREGVSWDSCQLVGRRRSSRELAGRQRCPAIVRPLPRLVRVDSRCRRANVSRETLGYSLWDSRCLGFPSPPGSALHGSHCPWGLVSVTVPPRLWRPGTSMMLGCYRDELWQAAGSIGCAPIDQSCARHGLVAAAPTRVASAADVDVRNGSGSALRFGRGEGRYLRAAGGPREGDGRATGGRPALRQDTPFNEVPDTSGSPDRLRVAREVGWR